MQTIFSAYIDYLVPKVSCLPLTYLAVRRGEKLMFEHKLNYFSWTGKPSYIDYWENFCPSKSSPSDAEAVLHVANIALEGLFLFWVPDTRYTRHRIGQEYC